MVLSFSGVFSENFNDVSLVLMDLNKYSIKQTAIKHQVSESSIVKWKKQFNFKKGLRTIKQPDSYFNKEELKKGIKIEMEHTENENIAKNIAKHHLLENPKYYSDYQKCFPEEH